MTSSPCCCAEHGRPGISPRSRRWNTGTCWRPWCCTASRCYTATDNLLNPAWTTLTPTDAIRAVADAGLQFDSASGIGVVLHMLSGLAIDGRLGLTAIGHTPQHADDLYRAVTPALHAIAGPT